MPADTHAASLLAGLQISEPKAPPSAEVAVEADKQQHDVTPDAVLAMTGPAPGYLCPLVRCVWAASQLTDSASRKRQLQRPAVAAARTPTHPPRCASAQEANVYGIDFLHFRIKDSTHAPTYKSGEVIFEVGAAPRLPASAVVGGSREQPAHATRQAPARPAQVSKDPNAAIPADLPPEMEHMVRAPALPAPAVARDWEGRAAPSPHTSRRRQTPPPPPLRAQVRCVRYSFPPSFLRARTIRTLLEFKVGDQPLPAFRMIERHFFQVGGCAAGLGQARGSGRRPAACWQRGGGGVPRGEGARARAATPPPAPAALPPCRPGRGLRLDRGRPPGQPPLQSSGQAGSPSRSAPCRANPLPQGKLVRSYDFSFGFVIPGSTNSWEAVYELPQLSDSELADYVGGPGSRLLRALCWPSAGHCEPPAGPCAKRRAAGSPLDASTQRLSARRRAAPTPAGQARVRARVGQLLLRWGRSCYAQQGRLVLGAAPWVDMMSPAPFNKDPHRCPSPRPDTVGQVQVPVVWRAEPGMEGTPRGRGRRRPWRQRR
jgi:hypothetical protein